MSKPKVTALCLCYNTGNYVIEAIKSILSSTYQNIEIIVIDDYSNDNISPQILESYLEDKKHIKYIRNERNLGIPKTLNKGLSVATGKYLLLVSDDLISKNKIQNDVLEFESLNNEYVLVHSIAQIIDSDGNKYPDFSPTLKYPKKFPDKISLNEMIANSFIHTPTAMFRVDFLKSNGGWDESLLFEDKPMWFKISELGKSIRFRPEVTTYYRRHDKNISSQIKYGFFIYQFELYSRYSSNLNARRQLNSMLKIACGAVDFKECLAIYKKSFGSSLLLFKIWSVLHPIKKFLKLLINININRKYIDKKIGF